MKCSIEDVGISVARGKVEYRVRLESFEKSFPKKIETGHVKWENVRKDSSWHPSNSVDFIMED